MKKFTVMLISFILTLTLLSATVSADMGPKPSVNITFINMGSFTCYCTLLSQAKNTGPYGVNESDNYEGNDIETAFHNYKDKDGFYYLETYANITGGKRYSWSYYPPKTFKVLLYFPASNSFAISGIIETYAFDSNYTVDLRNLQIGKGEQLLEVKSSNSVGKEIAEFIIRVVLTVIIEFFIAYAFCFRKKEQIILIVVANIVTQILLNILLKKAYITGGTFLFMIAYIPLEIVVFIAEGVIYSFGLRFFSENGIVSVGKCFGYSFTANLASFIAGVIISIFLVSM